MSLSDRQILIEYLNSEDDGSPQKDFIEKIKPFYKNLRDQIENPHGFLYGYKLEFDTLSKTERDNILFKLNEQYKKGKLS